MPGIPTGTVTFLFTDIEGSTQLLQLVGDTSYAQALEAHRRVLRAASQESAGHEIETQGDGFLFAFQSARAAITAALAAQQAIAAYPWPSGATVRVRMGIHTGETVTSGGAYVGLDVHRAARICAAGWGGQVLLSQTTGIIVEPVLPPGTSLKFLGEFRLKDLLHQERLFQLLHPDLPADFPPLRTLERVPHNLPIQLTSFIGRDREIAEVKALLATTPLLTLAGFGGFGKTRLALQVAAELAERFHHGVWLVELAPLADPALVPQAVVSALHLRAVPGQPPLVPLLEHLRSRQVLLVLDNCEHLIGACAELAEGLLRTCRELQIVATSREPLRIQGETVYRVPAMHLPDARDGGSPETLTQYEAIRLFLERAAAAVPEFRITDGNAVAVVQICRRLDGIPLAIELAAARVKVLPLHQIAERLDERFRLLVGGGRTTPSRHQSLRATLDWSYDLLTDRERMLFRRLSVFAGGWTLDAAEAICAETAIRPQEVLDLLTGLVDKSVATTAPRHGAAEDLRYLLLDTIRQYAAEKLDVSGEAPDARRLHREFYRAAAERAEPELHGPDQARWLRRLEEEHDNLRAALESSRRADPTAGLRLAGALWWFWYVRGHWREGRAWLEEFAETAPVAPAAARATALYAAGVLAWRQGDDARAGALCGQSLELCRQVGDRLGTAFSLNILGIVAERHGEYARAAALGEESLALFRELNHPWGIALALNLLGIVADRRGAYALADAHHAERLALFRQMREPWGIATALGSLGVIARFRGDYRRAQTLHEESLGLRRELGDRLGIALSLGSLALLALWEGRLEHADGLCGQSLALFRDLGEKGGIASALHCQGMVASRRGDVDRAQAVCRESLALFQEMGDRLGEAGALLTLGLIALEGGDRARASPLLAQSLTLSRDLGHRRGIAECLEGFASLASAQGDADRSARLLGGAEALREAIGGPVPPVDCPGLGRLIATAREGLGGLAFTAAWVEGRLLPLPEAIRLALTAG